MGSRKTAGSKQLGTELLSRREAADYLGIAEQTLAVWKCSKRHYLPVVKVGRLVKYRVADLDQFLQRNTIDIQSDTDVPPRASMAKSKSSNTKAKGKVPAQALVNFAEVQLVEQKDRRTHKSANRSDDESLEVVLPSGIKLRFTPGCSLDLLSSVVEALESR